MSDTNTNNKYAAQNKYNAEKSKLYSVRLNNINDYDIIEVAEKQKSKNDFIKKALRYYIENGYTD